jgi:hypothetical protein
MSSASFLQRVLSGFAESLQPLQEAVASPAALAAFLGELGWALAPGDLTHVSGALGGLSSPADPSSLSLEQLAQDLISAATVIRRISGSGAPAAFAATFPRELLDFLVYGALAEQSPPVFGLLHFVGILSERHLPADAGTGRAEHIERQVHWDRLSLLADQPLKTVGDSYGWGASFEADAFLRSVGILVQGFGGRAGLYPADRRLIEQYYVPGSPGAAGTTNLILSAPLLEASVTSEAAAVNTKLAFLAIPIPPDPNIASPPDGLALMPVITGQAGAAFAISESASVKLTGDFLARPVRAEIHPGRALVRGSAGDSHVDASARLDAKAPAGSPWIPLGGADSSRLEVSAAHATLSMSGELDGDLDFSVEVGLDQAALLIDFGEGDGFVKNTVGSQPSANPLSFTLKWSSKSGFSIGGQPRLQITLPVQRSIGGTLILQSIGFSLGAGAAKSVELDAMLTLSVAVGPVAATISDIGLRILLAYLDDTVPPGNLGNLNLDFGFKPPSGVGLVVDSAGVSGGGFLKHDPAQHEYAGVLQLEYTRLALQAFGLITTQVAGGQGYSLLALIDADFPPVELGWGFTLDGVGGLLAVHRTASVDALRAALKADKLSTILFPKNAIASAPQILAALDAYFPTAPGRFLFGPMALIGWGTPTVLTAAIAVVVELPEPIRILLLARVEARFPSPSAPLVRINMDALGVLDLSQSALSLDATLFDSRLLTYVISGDMALRATWSGQREFLLAIGGFHPRFTPPADFPALQRIAINMPSGIVSKLRLAAYLAITSNTVQFGAELDVFIGVSGFGLAGQLGFDALLQLDPFHFDADISGSVALTAGSDDLMSVELDATLSGPAPWNIAGNFKIHLLFFDVHKSFSHSWGEDAPALNTAAVDVGKLLATALADPRSWAAQLPAGAPAQVSVRQIEDPTAVLAHPLALPEVHERIVPLGLDITRFGGAAPAGATRFAITDLRIGGGGVNSDPVQDDFAPAQFFELSDEEKLARPSFERHDAGLRLGAVPVASGSSVAKDIDYETFYVDAPGGPQRTDPPAGFWLVDLQAIREVGSAARAASTRTANRRYQTPGNPIRVQEPAFVVVDADTLLPVGPAAGTVYSDAQALLNGEPARDPGGRGALQIVATHEMAGA